MMCRHLLACALLCLVTLGQAQKAIDSKNVLVFKDKAFLVGPPSLAAGPAVRAAHWSTDGHFILVHQLSRPRTLSDFRRMIEPPQEDEEPILQPQETISIYDVGTASLRPALRMQGADSRVLDVAWLSDSSSALVLLSAWVKTSETGGRDGKLVYLLNAGTGGSQLLAPWGDQSPTDVYWAVSPAISRAILVATFPPTVQYTPGEERERHSGEHRSYLVDSGGRTLEIELPSRDFPVPAEWTEGGKSAHIVTVERAPDGSRKRVYHEIDLNTGKLKRVESPPTPADGVRPSSNVVQVRLALQPTMNAKAGATLSTAWLETRDLDTPYNRFLVAGDASFAEISPRGDTVAYITQDSLFVRPLLPISLEEVKQALVAEERIRRLSQAKQVGLALLIFASDNEDRLPTPAEFHEAVTPYLRNRDLLDGFSYTFPGGYATALENPDATELGFLTVEGGRIVVYADSHVVFVPDPS